MEVDWSKASTSIQLLIEAGLSTETRQDQDEWIPALAHHAATDVYESTDDYDQIKCVTVANQYHLQNTRNDSKGSELPHKMGG